MPASPENINDPNFTFAGEFLNAQEYWAPGYAWHYLDEPDPTRPTALPVHYFAGQFGHDYDPFERSSIFEFHETYIANKIISRPITDVAELEKRRDLLGALAGSGQLPQLKEALLGASALTAALAEMFVPHEGSFGDGEMVYDSYVMGKSEIADLEEVSFQGGQKLITTEEALVAPLKGVTTNAGNVERAAEILEKIGESFVASAENIANLGQRIGAVLNREAIDAVRSRIAELPEAERSTQDDQYPYDKELSELPGYGLATTRYYFNPDWGHFNGKTGDWAANVMARVVDLATVVKFAGLISEDGWHFAVPGVEVGVAGAWKFQQSKERQTLGDGLFNQYPIVGLVSSNGSGKTFATERDFGARIARQTLGHAPMSELNTFQLHSSFNMLGRYNSNGRGDHGELVNELQRWKQALNKSGDHPVFYLDEAMSTASPFGQAALNLAFARYIQEQGGFVSLATHNEHVANMLEEWQDAGLYTFGHNGSRYQMVEGCADSGFIEVARSRTLDGKYADLMEAYLRGDLAIEYAPNYPAIPNGYSQSERKARMLADGGLGYMFPELVHDAAYVLLSNDGNALKGQDNEHEALLYCSDPVDFVELVERQRTFKALAGYAELEDLDEDLSLLNDRLELFLEYVRDEDPATLLRHLNPIFMSEGFHGKKEPSLDDHGLIAKIAAYAELLAALRPDHDFGNLWNQLSELNAEAVQLWAAHETELLALEDQSFYARRKLGDQYQENVRNVLGRAVDRVLPVIEQTSFEAGDLNKFWLDEKMRPMIDALRSPNLLYNKETHDYTPYEFAKSAEKQASSASLLLALGSVGGAGSQELAKLMFAEPDLMAALEALGLHAQQIDSVHVRQGVSYLQSLTASYPDAPPKAKARFADGWTSKFSPLASRRSIRRLVSNTVLGKESELSKALKRLSSLTDTAQRVASGEYSLVDFNETGEVRLESVKSIFGSDKHQPFDYDLEANLAGTALSGEHSVGKTYSTQHVTNAVLMAMKTGVVPASSATLPYFERVSYISRVAQEMDADASAGQQEIDIWADHDRILSTAKTAITFADEVGSSTSPKYQAAFAAAAAAVNAARGHRLVITTHHDGFLDFAEKAVSLAVQGIVRDESGKRTINNTKVISNPIPFAKEVGLPERLVQLAEKYYAELTSRSK
ncbi:MAG TPA: hypothetical protein VG604_03090 [Candidatus Saccharimonadales bacterium]|nr:hypothetical protein [Candidatus Saccharimonadales bacterium]